MFLADNQRVKFKHLKISKLQKSPIDNQQVTRLVILGRFSGSIVEFPDFSKG